MEDRSQAALVALRQILRATEFGARNLARETGLTPSQLIILQLLHHLSETTPTELARRTSLTLATVTALVDKLEERGFVVRRRDDEDRRRIFVKITSAGKSALAGAPDALQAQFVERFAALKDWEQAALIAALERVVALLGADRLDAAPILDIGPLTDPPAKDR